MVSQDHPGLDSLSRSETVRPLLMALPQRPSWSRYGSGPGKL